MTLHLMHAVGAITLRQLLDGVKTCVVGLALFATYSMIAKPELERVFRRHK